MAAGSLQGNVLSDRFNDLSSLKPQRNRSNEREREKERKKERERERERGGCSLSLFLVQGSAEDYWKDLRIG